MIINYIIHNFLYFIFIINGRKYIFEKRIKKKLTKSIIIQFEIAAFIKSMRYLSAQKSFSLSEIWLFVIRRWWPLCNNIILWVVTIIGIPPTFLTGSIFLFAVGTCKLQLYSWNMFVQETSKTPSLFLHNN